MKRKIRTPYFEIGTKNYVYGDTLLEYAIAADKAAEKYDIDVLFICPAVEIRRVVENTKNLIVLAPYMDTLRPGRGMADILPEALRAAGFAVTETEVVTMTVPDTPGGMADLMQRLDDAGADIEYSYAYAIGPGEKAVLVFRFKDNAKAIAALG